MAKTLKNKGKYIAYERESCISGWDVIRKVAKQMLSIITKAEGSANRFNVVFVVDGSGSIKSTDENNWRYEAIDQFLGLLTDSGNRVGFVVFDDDIIAQSDIQAVDGIAKKKEISAQLRASEIRNDTNIGKALEVATTMLQQSGDANLRSVIILLSDGNTDLPDDTDGSQMEASLASKENAIRIACENGYAIYSVCLNSNEKANPAELQDISNSTGGGFMEVNHAEDLQAVFQEFYNMIYGTSTTKLWDAPVPEAGTLDIPFEVPQVGVEEVNIIVNNSEKLSDITLFQPSGTAFSNEEIDQMKMEGENFTIIKIAAPQAGIWRLTATGIPGDQVQIDMVFNANIALNLKLTEEKEEFSIGDTISLEAQVTANGEAVSNPEFYAGYTPVLHLQKGTNETLDIPMEAVGTYYTAAVVADSMGTWQVWADIDIATASGSSERLDINIGNQAPVAKSDSIRKRVFQLPFGTETVTLALDEAAEDPEKGEIIWQITNNPYQGDTVRLEGNRLTLRKDSITSGELKLRATDPYGASCEISVHLIAVDVVKYAVVIAGILLAAVVLLVLVLQMIKKNRRFGGDITVTAFDYNDGGAQLPETNSPSRGRSELRMYIADGCGIQLKGSQFIATGKDYIIFRSAKGYYSSGSIEKRSKKIRIDRDYEVIISNQQDLEAGIKVVFTPYQYQ